MQTPETQVPPKVRSDLHIARRLYHVFGVLLIVGLYLYLSRPVGLALLSGFVAAVLPLDYLRLRHSRFSKRAMTWFGKLIRTDELSSLSSMSYLLLGSLIVIAIFPKPVTTLALLMMGLGDPASSTFGILYGRDKIVGNKSLQGAIACFVVCTILAAGYFLIEKMVPERWVLASLLCGLIGTISELMPIGKLDDNLTFPVLSATLMWFLFRLFGAV